MQTFQITTRNPDSVTRLTAEKMQDASRYVTAEIQCSGVMPVYVNIKKIK